MNPVTVNPFRRVVENINNYFIAHPDVLESLLSRMGADSISHRYGHEIRCCCPLHSGSNRQGFTLYYDRGYVSWQCFSDSCGRGDMVSLVRKRYPGVSYEQAVFALGRYAGIAVDGSMAHITPEVIHEESMDLVRRRLGISNRQREVNIFPEQMAHFAIANLYRPQHIEALNYLTMPTSHLVKGNKCRQIPSDLLKQFEIGFVKSNEWVSQDPKSGQPSGYFEDRIVFPWRHVDGQLIGFAGRRIDGVDFCKYKTFPGTMRSLSLYGVGHPLCREAISRTKTLHLVEGYTDVLRGHQHRCHNIAAVGGTSLTEEQRKLLSKLGVKRVVYYRDGDDAGLLATKALGKELSTFIQFEVASPPNDMDPDDFLLGDDFWKPILEATPFHYWSSQ